MTTQTTLLPATVGTDVSVDVVLETGVLAKVGIFTANVTVLASASVSIAQKAPGPIYMTVSESQLNAGRTAMVLQGPGTFRFTRNTGSAIGVYMDQ